MGWLMRLGTVARIERGIDRSLARRKNERRRAETHAPTQMQVAALKGAATKRQQRRARDPLLSLRGHA